MVRGFPFAQYKWLLIPAGFLILIAGLSGCFQLPGQDPSSPAVVCTPESNQVNIYRSATPQPWVSEIFDYTFPSSTFPLIPPNPPSPITVNNPKIQDAIYATFLLLKDEAQHWSDSETIKLLADSSEVRITVTFISPELLQAVFLSNVLKDNSITTASDFQTQIQGMLNRVANREELLFLLTVTTSQANPNPHTIKIPIDDMELNNAENLKIKPSHDDHNLAQVIDTLSDPVFGYIAYPLAVLKGTQCKWVLDPRYNTNIVITLPSVEVDGVDNKTPYYWMIPYASLINPITITPSSITPIPTAPVQTLLTPIMLPPEEPSAVDYWQNFARFIWNQLTPWNY